MQALKLGNVTRTHGVCEKQFSVNFVIFKVQGYRLINIVYIFKKIFFTLDRCTIKPTQEKVWLQVSTKKVLKGLSFGQTLKLYLL